MNTKIAVFLASLLGAGIVIAETDYIALKVIEDIQLGKATKNAIDTLRVDGGATLAGDITMSSNEGNLGAKNEFQGLIKMDLRALTVMADGTDVSTGTLELLDDTPTGEWLVTTNAVTATNDLTMYRQGTNSLITTFSTGALGGDGITNNFSSDDFTVLESIGFWVRSDKAIGVSNLYTVVIDATANTTNFINEAIAKNEWEWIEVDITGLTGTTGDTVTQLELRMATAMVSKLPVVLHLDYMYAWDLGSEEALGQNIITDGVLSVVTIPTAAGTANTLTQLAETTDYIIHYQSGNDAIVAVSDQSAASGIALINYQ